MALKKKKGLKANCLEVLILYGGSGEIRTRDQRIKRSRGTSKPYINQCSKWRKNDCAIECAIAFLVQSSNF